MKKKNLKSLTLNKRAISHFKQEEVKGGITPIVPIVTYTVPLTISYFLCD